MKRKIIDWARWSMGLSNLAICGPAKSYSIAIIIPAYNEELSIAKTIESIRNQTVQVGEIIVVDDCSTDGTGRVAKESGAIVVRTPENQGTKAMAQNYVLSMVTAELVVTIDADTTLHPQAIEKTLRYFNDEKTASVCGFVIPQKIETLWERGRFIEYMYGIILNKSAQNHIGAVMVSSGCFSIFRTDILNKFGGFKQRTMAEDMDLTWEMTLAGHHIYCAQDSYCYPLDPPSADIFSKQVKRWYASFFQNVSIYKGKFGKKRRLGMIVYVSLLDAVVVSPLICVAGFFAARHNLLQALAFGLLLDLGFVMFTCSFKAYKLGMLRKVIFSVPCYAVIRPVNFAIFWKCLWNEWIVGNRLSTWEKGH